MRRFLLAALISGLACHSAYAQATDLASATIATDPNILNADDVRAAVETAAQAVASPLVVAVTDRQGNILAIYRKQNAPDSARGNFGTTVDANELAAALARTAGFFSNDQAPLSTRTVRCISGIHFPPGVSYTSNADLYGIENTNRGCVLNTNFSPGVNLPPARSIDGSRPGLGIQTGKADLFDSDPNAVNPGGVPLFKNGHVVGGIGVVASNPAAAEYAAFTAATSAPFAIVPAPPGVVIVGGIALPFVNQITAAELAGTLDGSYSIGPLPSPAATPEGDLIAVQDGTALSAADVRAILDHAIATANETRAVIRLPLGSKTRMVIAVADLNGTLLGLHRMPDATVFSVDVAVAKARNVIYFSQNPGNDLPGVPPGTAVNNRTIGFGAQPLFPPGIDTSNAGPFFSLFAFDSANPCTQGSQPANPNQNGIVFFPGALPLYKNGVLVGGLGISGDGVDQDDFVTAGAASGFEAPTARRADRISIDGVRLPYLKFPRNPTN